jgi:hypothetical protein
MSVSQFDLLAASSTSAVSSVGPGDQEYELEHDEGRVVTKRRRVVRGVALKTEELPVDAWIDELSGKLVAEAGRSECDRLALQGLLTD